MAVCYVWVWHAGHKPDGEPIVIKRLADGDVRPADVPSDAWLAEQDVDAWREEIVEALQGIDGKSIRALREGNVSRLAELEAAAERLRETLRVLSNG